jgi:hypothetical protein
MAKSKVMREHGPVVMTGYFNEYGNPREVYYVYVLPYHLLSQSFADYSHASKYFDDIVNGKVENDIDCVNYAIND